jgi:YqaJ-like viral recombinase domain
MKPPNFSYTTNVEKLNFQKVWKDEGNYWEHNAPQGTNEWKNVRIGRVGSSKSGGFVGQTEHFKNGTPEEIGLIISGEKEIVFDEKSIARMDHGTKYEKTAKIWYEKTYNCKVLERGFCVPKFDLTRIGASVDGDVIGTDGILEIKCPQKMYKPVLFYNDSVKRGWKPSEKYYEHIWNAHFSQCQHGMRILGKKWCDYIVYSVSDSQVFVQRIHFDPDYWKKHYSIIQKNYEVFIKPYLKTGYPIIPS